MSTCMQAGVQLVFRGPIAQLRVSSRRNPTRTQSDGGGRGAGACVRLLVTAAASAAAVVAIAPSASDALPATPFTSVTTGVAQYVRQHSATLEGSIRPSGAVPPGATARVYFQLGTSLPYELQSVDQALPANLSAPVHVSLTGLQSGRLYHYRLVSIDSDQRMSTGADRTFRTKAEVRETPGLRTSVSPGFQFTFPAVVRVSGSLVLPSGLSESEACNGFVDITFRVRTVAVQTLRAGVHRDCTFGLSVRFSDRRRLRGGAISVHVLFVGNRLLQRRAAPPWHIQLG